MDTSANCNLCANCIKNCPNDAITLTVRKPSSELWFIRKPLLEASVLAMAIMGIVLIQNLTMLELWADVLSWIEGTTGITSYPVIFTIAFAVAAPLAAVWAASTVAARRNDETAIKNFARFGYALIPLDVAGHIAHNLYHLLAEGKSVLYTSLKLFGYDSGGASAALVTTPTIQVLQYLVLAVGIAGSAYTAYRIARARYPRRHVRRATLMPYLAVIGLFAAANVVLFMLPMAHRM